MILVNRTVSKSYLSKLIWNPKKEHIFIEITLLPEIRNQKLSRSYPSNNINEWSSYSTVGEKEKP